MGLCSGKTEQVQPTQFDPLFGSTARNMREGMFSDMWSKLPEFQKAAQTSARSTLASANNPAFRTAEDNAAASIRGDYLMGSPALTDQIRHMRSGALRGAADQDANIRDQFARTGTLFSTGNQQAQQASTAALMARLADTEANTRAQNYAMERANQLQAPQQLAAAASAPGQVRAQAVGQYLDPYKQFGEIIKGLAGNGQLGQPDTIVGSSTGQDVAQGLGAAGALASGAAALLK